MIGTNVIHVQLRIRNGWPRCAWMGNAGKTRPAGMAESYSQMHVKSNKNFVMRHYDQPSPLSKYPMITNFNITR